MSDNKRFLRRIQNAIKYRRRIFTANAHDPNYDKPYSDLTVEYEKRIRSISEILIDADAADELKILSDCWSEIVTHKKNYPLSEIYFAKEHLCELSRAMARRHIAEIKPYVQPFLDLLNEL